MANNPRPPQCCGNCAHLGHAPDEKFTKAGYIINRSHRAYRCLWQPPTTLKLPDAITKAHGYQPLGSNRTYVQDDEGTTCPVWRGVMRGPVEEGA